MKLSQGNVHVCNNRHSVRSLLLSLTGLDDLVQVVEDGVQVRVVFMTQLEHDSQHREAVLEGEGFGHGAVALLPVHQVNLAREPE